MYPVYISVATALVLRYILLMTQHLWDTHQYSWVFWDAMVCGSVDKCRHFGTDLSTKLRSVTSQRKTISIFTTVRTSDLLHEWVISIFATAQPKREQCFNWEMFPYIVDAQFSFVVTVKNWFQLQHTLNSADAENNWHYTNRTKGSTLLIQKPAVKHDPEPVLATSHPQNQFP
jgi:hypothetical protein